MQDQYTGDIGDFGKYGLLRAICAETGLRLGVVWYLSAADKPTDGRLVEYLGPPHRPLFRDCDPRLYDALGEVVRDSRRSVATIRERGILPRGTVFFEKLLTFNDLPGIGVQAREARLARRQAWLTEAHEATRDCDLVFVDPDNGLEVQSAKSHSRKGPKYVFFSELEGYVDRHQSVIVYQHVDHTAPAHNQIVLRLAELEERLSPSTKPFALHYHRGTARAFLVVPSSAHAAALFYSAQRFVATPWRRHFDLVTPLR